MRKLERSRAGRRGEVGPFPGLLYWCYSVIKRTDRMVKRIRFCINYLPPGVCYFCGTILVGPSTHRLGVGGLEGVPKGSPGEDWGEIM